MIIAEWCVLDRRFSKREHFASLQEHIRFRKGIHRIGDFKVMDLLIQVVPSFDPRSQAYQMWRSLCPRYIFMGPGSLLR